MAKENQTNPVKRSNLNQTKQFKQEKSVAAKKSGSFGKGFLTAFLLCLCCILALFGGIFLNLGNLKGTAIQLLQIEKTQQDLLTKKEVDLEAKEKYLNDALTQLKTDQGAFEKEKTAVDAQKLENSKTAAALSKQKLTMEEMIAIYNQMSTQNAANILSALESETDLIKIMKNLDQKKAAQILSLMEPKRAAAILTKITEG